jgi:hypothetical protein
MILYPESLPRGLHNGRTYQTVSPLQRSELNSGRARQRRRFTSVPTMASISWIFNSAQAQAFEAWWRDALIDGSQWFECPLETPLGYSTDYVARFTDIYSGPNRLGPMLWQITAELELRQRPILPVDWGLIPDLVAQQAIFDIAMNEKWPLNPWQVYILETDTAINQEWPTP